MTKKSKTDAKNIRVYKFLLQPNNEQKTLINKTIGCARKVYNLILDAHIKNYKDYKEYTDKYIKDCLEVGIPKENIVVDKYKMPSITPKQFKVLQKYSYLNEVDSLALANAQLHVETAYKNFFKGNAKFPRFKSKKNCKLSYTTNCVNNSIRFVYQQTVDKQTGDIINTNNIIGIQLPKLGIVKLKVHRQVLSGSIIKNVTITHKPSGKYEISITTEVPEEELNLQNNLILTEDYLKNYSDRILGLDYDSKNLYTDNQGNRPDYPKFYYKSMKRLARLQKQFSRKAKKSKNREKLRLQIAKLHEHISNQRRDFLHKLSKILSEKYDFIIVEDINMQSMARALKLAKTTYDNSFGMFRTFLSYKLQKHGGQLIKVGKTFASTQICSVCGYKNTDIKGVEHLDVREWECPECHTYHDRDINAAINIKAEGMKLLSASIS